MSDDKQEQHGARHGHDGLLPNRIAINVGAVVRASLTF
jgi:hypothetical protein